MDDIKIIAKRKTDAQQHMDCLMYMNVSGRTPEELLELNIALAQARIELGRANADYNSYINKAISI